MAGRPAAEEAAAQEPAAQEPVTVIPVTGLPEITAGADLAALIAGAVPDLRAADILVVTSKIVSKAEGRVVTASRDQAIEAETVRVVARRPGKQRIVEARLIGMHKETDLALLKIEQTGLPTLSLGSRRPVHQGQLVFALGSPEGLENS